MGWSKMDVVEYFDFLADWCWWGKESVIKAGDQCAEEMWWSKEACCPDNNTFFLSDVSNIWQTEHAVYRINQHIEKQLQGVWVGTDVAAEKIKTLTTLMQSLRDRSEKIETEEDEDIEDLIQSHLDTKQTCYNTHRYFFNQGRGKTDTLTFVEGLAERVSPAA